MLFEKRIKRELHILKFFILILGSIFLFTGCVGGEDYKEYIDAANKTDEIDKSAQKIEVNITNTFNEKALEDMNLSDQKMFSALEQVSLNISSRFDQTKGQSLSSVYYVYQGLGTDIKLYQKSQDEMYLKLPFDSKMYQINQDIAKANQEQVDFKSLYLTIGRDWNNMLKSENIFIGEKSIITSDAGEVKATKFTVKPTSAQLSDFMGLLKSNVLSNKQMIIEYIGSFQEKGTIDAGNFENFVNALFDSMSITRFEEVAYVDIDGYVIDEQIEIEIDYTTTNNFTNLLKHQKITIKSSHWDIEKKQDLDFSDLNQSEIVPIDQLTKGSVAP